MSLICNKAVVAITSYSLYVLVTLSHSLIAVLRERVTEGVPAGYSGPFLRRLFPERVPGAHRNLSGKYCLQYFPVAVFPEAVFPMHLPCASRRGKVSSPFSGLPTGALGSLAACPECQETDGRRRADSFCRRLPAHKAPQDTPVCTSLPPSSAPASKNPSPPPPRKRCAEDAQKMRRRRPYFPFIYMQQ